MGRPRYAQGPAKLAGGGMTLAGAALRRDLHERFLEKFDRLGPDECWLWKGAPNPPGGYGRIGTGGRPGYSLFAHRVSYEFHIGPIPPGLVLDHLCSTPLCVNPNHLEAVTQQENVRRTVARGLHSNARKTHCKRGHEFTPENTLHRSRGTRECRHCRRELQRRSYWRLVDKRRSEPREAT